MPRKTMDIQFPAAGVVRRMGLSAAYRGGGPFHCPWAMNVRLEDALTKRLRGGSFTGIAAGTKTAPVYRDRAITFSGKAITAARQGDSTDTNWDTDISDPGRPILFQLAEAGETSSNVVSVVPHKDTYLLCFTATGTWIMSGDPATGTLRNVSREVGIIAADAWCKNHDTVYFLSSRGLYSVGADGGGLNPVSEDKIPEDLTGVSDAACVLDYNHADRGVYIHLTVSPSWFYDTARDQFWPFDTTETDSHVLLGPFTIGNTDNHGRVLSIQGTVAQASADVTWAIVPGTSPEEAAANGKLAILAALAGTSYSAYIHETGVWVAGRNHVTYPRTRAIAIVLWLSSTGTWAYESASLEALLSGRWK